MIIEATSAVLGMTQCDLCGRRYQVKKKLEGHIGKPIRCPKCNSMFMLQLEKPTPKENAATVQSDNTPQTTQETPSNKESAGPEQISKSGEGQETKPRRRRRKKRTSRQVRQEAIDEVADGLSKLHGRLFEMAHAEHTSEEQVRVWCRDVLRDALGYKDKQIVLEMPVLSKRTDIALMDDGKVFMIIECKTIDGKLSDTVRKQAVGYAAHLNAEWAVVTNGCIWKLFRVIRGAPGKEPESHEVFDISLLDEDGISDSDAESLYLLTAKAIFKGETTDEAHRVACVSAANLLQAIKSEQVAAAIKKQLVEQYKKECKIKVDIDDDLVCELVEEALSSKEVCELVEEVLSSKEV